jgi:Fe-S-cluster containining protein
MPSSDNKEAALAPPPGAPADSVLPSPLVLPGDISYTCQNSGLCCTTFDTIPVSESCANFLHQLTAEQEAAIREDAGSGQQSFTAPGMPGDPPRLTRKVNGSCVFFDKDRLCAVHRIVGAHAKPQVCRDFPYRYVESSAGTFVGLSFVCPAVRDNKGTPVREQHDVLQEHFRVAASKLDGPKEIALNRRISLEWAEYLQLEATLLELMSLRDVSLSHRLISCCALITFVDAYHQQLAGSPVAGPGNHLPHGSLEEFLNTLRGTGYRELLRVAMRPRKTSPAVKRMFVGMFAGFANTLHRSGGRLRTVATVLTQYVRHAAGIGGVRLKPLTVLLSHAELDGVKLPTSEKAAELLERYIRHCIFRKDLVLSANVARRMRLLVLNVALVPWYAMAEAKVNQRAVPADEDYSEAIVHVEKFYGFHSRFYRFFEENATFDDIVEAFLLKPNYPYMLLGDL